MVQPVLPNGRQRQAIKILSSVLKCTRVLHIAAALTNKEFITTEFLRGIVAFEKHLGPVFVQVSDAFTTKRKEELFNFLRSLPTDMQFFLEVRHPDWFAKEDLRMNYLSSCKSINMGIVITDTAGRRDCAHMHLNRSQSIYPICRKQPAQNRLYTC
jgi:uncharacterized protein YecE (DUF72 family)